MSLFGLFKKEDEVPKEKGSKGPKDTSFYSQSGPALP